MSEARAAAISVFRDAELDELDPPRGRCLLCGHPDARHHLWNLISRSGRTDELEAAYQNVSIELVRVVRRLRPYQ